MVGGQDTDGGLSSTEMFKIGDTKWTLLSSTLPFPVSGIRGATVHNTLYITGGTRKTDGWIDVYLFHNTILKFDLKTKRWTLAGRMKEDRNVHAVSEIDFTDVAEYCQ